MKILVADDEPLARERLCRLVHKARPQAECLEAADGDEALDMVQRFAPELVLLDIRMPGHSGIEVASALSELDSPPAIIFCTAYDEYALEAIQQQAVAYLLKPVREADLEKALLCAGKVNRLQLARIADTPETGSPVISSQTHRGLETLRIDEVRCFIAEHKYVTAYAPGSQLVLQQTLKELEDQYGAMFHRIHRNALVSMAYLDRLAKSSDGIWRAVLDGVEVEPQISRRHLTEIKDRIREQAKPSA